MKKISLLVCSFFACTLFAQTKQMTPGKYISDKDNVTIKIKDDQTFELVFVEGKYSTKNDTIYFGNPSEGKDSFLIKETTNGESSDSITVQLNSDYMYYMDKVYIGTQKDDQGKVQYNSVLSYLNLEDPYDTKDQKEYRFTIPNTTTLYLVESGYKRDQPVVSTYTLQKKTATVEIVYKPLKYNDLNLKGYYDAEQDKFGVTDGKRPLFFSSKVNTAKAEDKNVLIPSSVLKDATWKVPVLAKVNSAEEVAVEALTESSGNTVVKSAYKPSESLKKALKGIANSKEKYVVVAYNPDHELGKKDFAEYTNTIAKEDTVFKYYLAKTKDVQLFKNNKIATEAGIVVLNATSDILYYSPGSLIKNKDRFKGYYDIKKNIKTAAVLTHFDALLQQEKVTTADQKKAFELVLQFNDKYQFEDHFIASKGTKTSPKQAYYYNLKSSKATINSAWGALLDAYKKEKNLDQKIVTLIKNELDQRGFNYTMFNEYDDLCSAQDIKAIQYILKFYNAIPIAHKTRCCSATEEEEHIKRKEIDRVLLSVFSRNMNTHKPTMEHIDTIKPLFKEYISVSNNDHKVVHSYLNALKRDFDTNTEEYYNTYKLFYQLYFDTTETNIFENLNTVYASSASASNTSWTSFKYTIANTANTVAWSIVENSDSATKSKWIEDAIKWSEMSIQITPDNPYYLDTLGQLYYQHGAKEKAIATQEKAYAIGVQQFKSDESVLIEIKSILEKMKNGTY